MGQNKGLRTYGRHRKRCVVTAEDELSGIFGTRPCHTHIFSTSSSESGIGPSDSIDSSGGLPGAGEGRPAKTKALQKLRKLAQKCTEPKSSKEDRCLQNAVHLFGSDKGSCCSSSSGGFTPASDRKKHVGQQNSRATRKKNYKRNVTVNKNTTKAESKKRDFLFFETTQLSSKKAKCSTSPNFSEFEDYSLIISDSPAIEKDIAEVRQESKEVVGTSTPRQSTRQGVLHSVINPTDISHISPFSDKQSEPDENELTETVASPSFCAIDHVQTADNLSRIQFCNSASENESDLELNLKRLQEGVKTLRVSNRRRKQPDPLQLSDWSVHRQLSPQKNGFHLHRPNWSEDNAIVADCKIRIQRLRESLLQKTILFASDFEESPRFEASRSLFTNPELGPQLGNKKLWSCETANSQANPISQLSNCSESDVGGDNDSEEEEEDDDSDHDAGSHGSEDLSAIHEEEEEEEEETEDDSEDDHQGEDDSKEYEDLSLSDKQGSKANGKWVNDVRGVCDTNKEARWKAAKTIDDSLLNGSPIRYMLTDAGVKSLKGNNTLFQVRQTEARLSDCLGTSAMEESVFLSTSSDSIVKKASDMPNSSRKSVATDASCSLLEILTPSESRRGAVIDIPAKERVLQQCKQDAPLPFSTVIPQSFLENCAKIGEGVYGEVFRIGHGDFSVALKIIPIEGKFEVNGEKQKTFDEILPEIVISSELSRLRDGTDNSTSNFCPVRSVSCVQGRYPAELLKQWDLYDKEKKSENDRPGIFGDDQLYIMFEFGDGGCDLDSCMLQNAAQGVSVLRQVAGALAIAEEVMQFEHRDLHIGNVLVQPTDSMAVTVVLNGSPFTMDSAGVHVSIIDFTLSRLSKDGLTAFCDLATDDTLFEGKGDYQFDIYRLMKKENNNNWEAYHPYTNVLWLHYICDKLINTKRYRHVGRGHRESMKLLKDASQRLLQYNSAAEFVIMDGFFRA